MHCLCLKTFALYRSLHYKDLLLYNKKMASSKEQASQESLRISLYSVVVG